MRESLIEQAFEKFDIALLDEALEAGADINAQSEGVPLLSDAFWNAAFDFHDHTHLEQAERFIKHAIDKGLDINAYEVDNVMRYPILFQACHSAHNLELVEFLSQNGADPNFMVIDLALIKKKYNAEIGNYSLLDAITDEFYDEAQIGYQGYAKFYHDAALLLVAYGAKPAELLDGSHGMPKRVYDAVMSLDPEKLHMLPRDEFSGLESKLVFYSKFDNLELFCHHTDEYQKKLTAALDVVIEKIGVDNLSPTLLCDSVAYEWPDVVEFLLSKGVNPNINCYTQTYAYVSSSALDYLERYHFIYQQDNYARMKAALKKAGAKIKKTE